LRLPVLLAGNLAAFDSIDPVVLSRQPADVVGVGTKQAR
jgi:hypothetical protein